MSKEANSTERALKLALEALENNRRTHYYCEDTWYSCPKHEEGCANESEGDECNCGADKANVEIDGAITALREALNASLAKPDFWEGYVPEPVKPAQCKYPKCIYPCPDLPDCRDAEQPAQQALDKMAENARELGLDYEPVWGGGPTNKDYEDAMRQRRLHQLTSPPAQRTWVGLTDEDDIDWEEGGNLRDLVKAIEAKLRSKNEDRN